MTTLPSQRWGYVRIITGTILGGVLGFYLMHCAETSYKKKWDERLKKYEEEKMRKERIQLQAEDSLYFAEKSSSQQSN